MHPSSRRYRARPPIRKGFERVPDLFGHLAAQAARGHVSDVDDCGWVTITIPIEKMGQSLGEFLRLGVDVRVIEPVEPRDRIAARVKELDGYCSGRRDCELHGKHCRLGDRLG